MATKFHKIITFINNRYYYDVKAEECKQFVFGGCGGNQRNIFLNMKDCRQTCKDPGKKPIDEYHYPNVFCRLQPEFGGCSDYNPIEIMDLDYDVFCKFQPNSHNCFEDNLGLPE
ncbi:hypothetical protein MSG28_001089 [Choristoneura fumiferana]|uniref:Uncharacterized protein n=1 Tax=Choristoneura fumiferana TaxID=7141 RepID=A0ACC0K3L4_CHOFU|nr:hypothetical protein MSG28_001089 [Choristoneura fumiferana]